MRVRHAFVGGVGWCAHNLLCISADCAASLTSGILMTAKLVAHNTHTSGGITPVFRFSVVSKQKNENEDKGARKIKK